MEGKGGKSTKGIFHGGRGVKSNEKKFVASRVGHSPSRENHATPVKSLCRNKTQNSDFSYKKYIFLIS